MGDADRVGDLDLAALRQAGGDDVLRHVAGGVGGGAVDLGRVLAGEGAAAVAGHASVGVDDDLAAGEAGVADRAADHELAGRVDEELALQLVLVEAIGDLGPKDREDDALPQLRLDLALGVDPLVVLGGDQKLFDGDGAAVGVADADLGLAVGAEVAERSRPCGRRPGVRPAGGRGGSASASAPRSRRWRSRTSSPGRPRRRRRARRRRRDRLWSRRPGRRPGRCRATARRSR